MNQQQKYIKMTTEPVGKLISKLAVPTVLSMLVTTFYNMADTYFVGQIKGEGDASTFATGAVSVIFSFMAIIQACGFFFGHGSGNYISKQLGKENYDEAEKMAAAGFVSAFVFGAFISIVGFIFTNSLAKLLGANDYLLPYAVDYLRMILIGVPFMTSSLVLNNQLRFQGNAMYAMVGIISGAVINVALDPLFIITCDMGVAGAGLATVISQIISFVLLYLGSRRGDSVKIRLKKFVLSKFYTVEIIKGGLPSLGRQSVSSIATVCLNYATTIAAGILYSGEEAKLYAAAGIAAFGVVSKILFFGNAVVIGCGQGFQPVCGFNYGAGKYGRVRKAFWFTFKLGTVFAIIATVLFNVFNKQIIDIFKINEDAKQIARVAFRYQSWSFVLSVFITVSNMMMQNIGKVGKATVLAISRQGIMFIPIVFAFAYLFGMVGVELSQVVADVLTFLLSLPLGISVLKELNVPDEEKNDETDAIESVELE